eukprot:snap_masked-scaffold_4-processed-gene-10.6-mRNA-1 protein AED:1.00 eAED:1.00 QI:0/-1/0/0/-1/1/1/0/165
MLGSNNVQQPCLANCIQLSTVELCEQSISAHREELTDAGASSLHAYSILGMCSTIDITRMRAPVMVGPLQIVPSVVTVQLSAARTRPCTVRYVGRNSIELSDVVTSKKLHQRGYDSSRVTVNELDRFRLQVFSAKASAGTTCTSENCSSLKSSKAPKTLSPMGEL